MTLTGSTTGVPDLIVEAHHVTGRGRSARLASTVSGSDGAFRIRIPVPPWHLSSRFCLPKWDVQVVVLAPEAAGSDRNRRMVFSSEIRRGVVSDEEFRIGLSPDVLKAAGIPVPTAVTAPAETVAEGIEATYEHAKVIQDASDSIFTARFDSVATRRTMYRDGVRERLRAELSAVSDSERASGRFVSSDDEIETVHRTAVAADVSTLVDTELDPEVGTQVGKIRRPSRFLLTKDAADAIFEGTNQLTTLTEEELEQALGVALDKPPAVYRRHLEPDPCRPRNDADRCLDVTGASEGQPGGEAPDEGPSDDDTIEGPSPVEDGPVVGGNVVFDRDRAVAALFDRQVPPEHPVEFAGGTEFEGPLTAGGVSDAISGVQLAPGPADVPAFHDFHDLQVAFEPVWQEALDDRLLGDVEAAYEQIVERGGEPAVNEIGGLLATQPVRFFDRLLDSIWDLGTAADSEVPPAVASAVYISLEEWRALPPASRTHLSSLATRIQQLRERVIAALNPDDIPKIDVFDIGELVRVANTKASIALRAQIQLLTSDAERLVAHGRRLLLDTEANKPFRPTHDIIDRLRAARGSSYPFRFFAASARHRSVNFGLMVTYRQRWSPVSYQVGELVSTIPLAPKEIRRFSKRTVLKTKRAQHEVESNLISRRMESEERSRAEAEIVARAAAKTNFAMSQSGTVSVGKDAVGGSATTTSTFTRDAEQHSQSVKKEFREAILKSAEEYRNERKLEVTTEEVFESEFTESGEIQNPNDEIPVTFLFYELQRRFRVSEKLHRLQSVVLVAQEVPPPSAIDAAWLVRHDWILNRVLLDDSFNPALGYASTSVISEEVVLKEMRQALLRHRKLVEELKEDVEDRRAGAGLRYSALQRQIERTASSAGSGGGGLFGGLGKLVGGLSVVGDLVQGGLDLLTGGKGGPSEAAQIREGAARDAYDRERREEEQLASRLQNALSSLEAMQRQYTERLASHLTQVAQVERLCTHVVQNIAFYMQAIWAHEPDDQRYLRLRNVPVPVFEKDKAARRYTFDPNALRVAVDRPMAGLRPFHVRTDLGLFNPPAQPQQVETKPLSEVADIGRPVGFLGNYMIFPMIESNPITEFMMDPYVSLAEGEYGVSDPDPLGNMTLEEFAEYVCCLKKHFEDLEEGDTDGDDVGEGDGRPSFEDLKPDLRDTLRDLLQRSLRNDEEIVVPSASLYIEALPGAHSVMEKFKHLHRQIDVKAAQEQLRRVAVDNVRRAQRILDGDLEDPDIEAKYVFEGDGAVIAPAPGPGGA
ncbi:hypothetical protein ACWGH4_00690 [Streptomyces sp. NPDC054847]